MVMFYRSGIHDLITDFTEAAVAFSSLSGTFIIIIKAAEGFFQIILCCGSELPHPLLFISMVFSPLAL